MKDFIGKFSLRELLEIVFPGVYCLAMILPAVEQLCIFKFIEDANSITNTTLFSIGCILIGIIIYSLDIPKKIWFFKRNTPTYLIEKKESIDSTNSTKKYFDLYYNEKEPKERKELTTKYTGIFHFLINISVASAISIIPYLIINKPFYNLVDNYSIFALLIGFVSFITAWRFFEQKIKKIFLQQHSAYEKTINHN